MNESRAIVFRAIAFASAAVPLVAGAQVATPVATSPRVTTTPLAVTSPLVTATPLAVATPAPVAAPTAAPVPSAPVTPAATVPLIAPPAGFRYTPGNENVGGLRIPGKYEKTGPGGGFHFLYAGRFSAIGASSLGGDVAVYAKTFAHGIVAGTPGSKLVASGRTAVCGEREGYRLEIRVAGRLPMTIFTVLTLGNDKMYGAFYVHSRGTPALPSALASIASLCPPE